MFNPIENAVQNIADKNRELEEAIAHHETLPARQGQQSFTMAVKGVAMAAVNGGLANYHTFITGSYRESNPEIAEDVMSTTAKQRAPAALAEVREGEGREKEGNGEGFGCGGGLWTTRAAETEANRLVRLALCA